MCVAHMRKSIGAAPIFLHLTSNPNEIGVPVTLAGLTCHANVCANEPAQDVHYDILILVFSTIQLKCPVHVCVETTAPEGSGSMCDAPVNARVSDIDDWRERVRPARLM